MVPLVLTRGHVAAQNAHGCVVRLLVLTGNLPRTRWVYPLAIATVEYAVPGVGKFGFAALKVLRTHLWLGVSLPSCTRNLTVACELEPLPRALQLRDTDRFV